MGGHGGVLGGGGDGDGGGGTSGGVAGGSGGGSEGGGLGGGKWSGSLKLNLAVPPSKRHVRPLVGARFVPSTLTMHASPP